MTWKILKKRWALALGLLALGALVLAGCGSSSSGSSTESATAASGGSESSGTEGKGRGGFEISEEAKACLKEKGAELPGFKGGEPPQGGEKPEGGPPAGAGGPGGEGFTKMKQAFEECGVETPGFKGGPGGEGGAPNMNSAAFKKQVDEYAACVREHGYELAEPNFSGEGPIFEKSESESAAFKKASTHCTGLLGGEGSTG
jgi:hypothetical protein